ncbi:MAG: hypothetical protein SFY69_11725 [Planctomycetota bacterium]|nr:hypothetical protein [Planctomycetota bacterium]
MKKCVLAGLALAAAAGSAYADGRIWAQDATGRYNGHDAQGGAFIMNRIGNSSSAAGPNHGTSTNYYHTAQFNAGYVGSTFGTNNGLGGNQFYTFCIERGENVSLGNSNANGNRYFAQIADSAKNGGSGTSNARAAGPRNNGASEDVISFATAAIYREFRNGGNFGGVGTVLGGYSAFAGAANAFGVNSNINIPSYGAGSNEAAGRRMSSAVQWAIWYAENELSDADITTYGDATVRALGMRIFNWANQSSVHGNTLGQVRVLRLWTGFNSQTGVYSGNSQDQLTLIPLPSGAALAFAGMGVLAIRRRTTR